MPSKNALVDTKKTGYEIFISENKGRGIKATRDFKPGNLIISDGDRQSESRDHGFCMNKWIRFLKRVLDLDFYTSLRMAANDIFQNIF